MVGLLMSRSGGCVRLNRMPAIDWRLVLVLDPRVWTAVRLIVTVSAGRRCSVGDDTLGPALECGARRIQGPRVEPAHAARHSLSQGSVGHR
jgi:hypothetical protein